jgi:hypothetical protein
MKNALASACGSLALAATVNKRPDWYSDARHHNMIAVAQISRRSQVDVVQTRADQTRPQHFRRHFPNCDSHFVGSATASRAPAEISKTAKAAFIGSLRRRTESMCWVEL